MSDSDKEIFCYFYEKGELQINPDGQVFPCCFIANSMFVSKTFDYPKPGTLKRRGKPDDIKFQLEEPESIAEWVPRRDWIYSEYIENENDLCLDNKSINEIINHEWFKKIQKAREKWETAPIICQEHCTVGRNGSGHMSRKKTGRE
tara:strand:+ start:71 stop:508 length:438 start_codon:yes stop_codon:yes gene_type:complete